MTITINNKSEINAKGNLSNGKCKPVLCINDGEVYTSGMDAAKKLILTESEPFEYIEQKYVAPTPIYNSSRDYYGGYVQTSLFDYAKDDMMIHLEVVFVDQYGEENSAESEGNTKAEAWANLFMENPDVCFNMIEDYSFM